MKNAPESIKQAYKEISVAEGRLPLSINIVSDKAGIDREVFRTHYIGLGAVSRDIWADYFKETLTALEQSPEFANYSVREKLLAFYFTFFELLGQDRDFIKLYAPKLGIWNYSPEFLLTGKQIVLRFIQQLVEEGNRSGEIEERIIIATDYTSWHWPQFLYILNLWINDESDAYQHTDKAIEKSVNLGFDLMGRNVLDSAFEFLKFLATKS